MAIAKSEGWRLSKTYLAWFCGSVILFYFEIRTNSETAKIKDEE